MGDQEARSDDPSQVAQERDHTETEEEHCYLSREFGVYEEFKIGLKRRDSCRATY